MHKSILAISSFLLLLGLTGLFSSCSEESLEDKIIGHWSLNSLATDCIPMDTSNLNAFVLADDNGCVALTYMSTNGSASFTYTTNSCMSLFFEDDDSGYLISGNPSQLDSLEMTYSIRENNNELEICITNNYCLNYNYNGEEITLVIAIATMTSNECVRTFNYGKNR